MHGRDEVVIVSAEEYHRLKGDCSGEAPVVALQASPYRDVKIEPERVAMPALEVDL